MNMSLKKILLQITVVSLIIVLLGQITSLVIPINYFPKYTGKLTSMSIWQTSYSAGGRYRKGSPNYSLVILLDNKNYYTIDLIQENANIQDILKAGDVLTGYQSTKFYDIISLDILNYGNGVKQVECNNQIVDSFSNHKKGTWPFIICLIIAIIIVSNALRDLKY